MSRKWNLPLTYGPKIVPVVAGAVRQTIRGIGKNKVRKQVGDLIRFYTWSGKPYHSRRMTITDYTPLTRVFNCKIYPEGIETEPLDGKVGVDYLPWHALTNLAILDGIVPPTGEELRDVLMSKNKIPKTGIEAQILRW